MPLFNNWMDMPEFIPREGISQRGFKGDNVMLTYNVLTPELEPKPHSHTYEQLFMIIKGRVRLHMGDQVIDCVPGTMLRIPPGVTHWCEPPLAEDGECINVDIFSHVRDDYLHLVAHQDDAPGNEAPN